MDASSQNQLLHSDFKSFMVLSGEGKKVNSSTFTVFKKQNKTQHKEFTAKCFEFTRDPSLPFLKIIWGETGICSGRSGFPNGNKRVALIHRRRVLTQSLKVMGLTSEPESSKPGGNE